MTPRSTKPSAHLDALGRRQPRVHARRTRASAPARQPVHTVYGGAHLFKAETTPRLGELALRDAWTDATRRDRRRDARPRGVGVRRDRRSPTAELADDRLRPRARQARSASRSRTSASTSRTASARAPTPRRTRPPIAAAREVARGMRAGHAAAVPRHPHQVVRRGVEGARRAHARASSSTRCSRETGGRLPDNFVVTLPKVTIAEQPRDAGAAVRAPRAPPRPAAGHAAAAS